MLNVQIVFHVESIDKPRAIELYIASAITLPLLPRTTPSSTTRQHHGCVHRNEKIEMRNLGGSQVQNIAEQHAVQVDVEQAVEAVQSQDIPIQGWSYHPIRLT